MVQFGDVGAFDIDDLPRSNFRVDEQFNRPTILSLGRRPAMGWNVLVQEALPQILHCGRFSHPGMLSGRILACLRLSNDAPRFGPGLFNGYRSMSADRHLDLAATTSAFNDVGLSAGWAHTNAEAR